MLRGFYAIVDVPPSSLTLGATALSAWVSHQAEAVLPARPCMLQLRAKTASPAQLLAWSTQLLPLCRQHGVPFCVNDRLDVALAVGADAVHLGQDDLPLAAALHVLRGRTTQVGISTHNVAQARDAAAHGAHYIGFGPVFATTSKANPDPTVGLASLAQVVSTVPLPVVAIGGITLETIAAVAGTGVAAVAVISAVSHAADPLAAARQVQSAFAP